MNKFVVRVKHLSRVFFTRYTKSLHRAQCWKTYCSSGFIVLNLSLITLILGGKRIDTVNVSWE